MNTQSFLEIYTQQRHPPSKYHNHTKIKNFFYSDGLKDLNLPKLINILAEVKLKDFLEHDSRLGIVKLTVIKQKAKLVISFYDGDERPIHKKLKFINAPDGIYDIYMFINQEEQILVILPTEY